MPVNVLQYRVTETWLKKSGFYVYTASYKAAGSQTFRDLWCGFQMVLGCALQMMRFLEYVVVSSRCCGFQNMLQFLDSVVVSRQCHCGFQIMPLQSLVGCLFLGSVVVFQMVPWFLDGVFGVSSLFRCFQMVPWLLDGAVVVSRWYCGFQMMGFSRKRRVFRWYFGFQILLQCLGGVVVLDGVILVNRYCLLMWFLVRHFFRWCNGFQKASLRSLDGAVVVSAISISVSRKSDVSALPDGADCRAESRP